MMTVPLTMTVPTMLPCKGASIALSSSNSAEHATDLTRFGFHDKNAATLSVQGLGHDVDKKLQQLLVTFHRPSVVDAVETHTKLFEGFT